MAHTESVEGPLRGSTLLARTSSLRLSQTWALSSVLIPVLVLTGLPLVAIDLAYQLRAGEIMLQTHSLLRTDVFTATSTGTPWLNQQWLPEILLAGAFRVGGWLGLVVLRGALAAAILWFIFLACRAAGASTNRAALLTLATGVLLPAGFGLRPQLFGMVCFAATALLVARRGRSPRGLWLVVPITVLWANLHGTFFLAPVLLALAWVEDRSRGRAEPGTLLVGGASLLATMVNPYGVRVWSYALGLSTNPVIRKAIAEWQPPTIASYTGAMLFASVVGVAVLLIARVRRPVPWASLLPLLVFLVIGLMAIRGAYWWAMAAPIVLAGTLDDPPARPERRDPAGLQNVAIVGLLVVAILAILIRWVPYTGRSLPEGGRLTFAPVGITSELHRVLVPGEVVFNAQEWGSWLEFEFPDNPVVVDSRIEVLPEDVWWKTIQVSSGVEGWQRVLDSWHVDVAVLARDQQPGLIPRMKADPGWELVYEDAEGLIFRRVSTPVAMAGPAGGTTLRSSR